MSLSDCKVIARVLKKVKKKQEYDDLFLKFIYYFLTETVAFALLKGVCTVGV